MQRTPTFINFSSYRAYIISYFMLVGLQNHMIVYICNTCSENIHYRSHRG